MPSPTVAVPVISRYISRIMAIEPIRRQSLISLANVVGLSAIGYIATMYFAHVLGPAILGSYYLFLSYYGVFALVGDGGFGGAAVKRISEGREANEYFSAFIVLRVILLAVSLTALLLLSPYFTDFISSGLFPWLFLALIAGTIAGFAAAGVYGSGKVGIAQISDFLTSSLKIAAQIVATFLGYAAAGLAGGFILGLLAGFLINFHYLPLRLARFSVRHLKSLFSFSFWIFLTSTGFTIFATADTILIGYFLTNADVGIYRVAYQLTGIATLVCIAVNTALFPRISRWNTDNDLPAISSALPKAVTFSLLLAVPIVTGGILLGERLLYFLYGADFVAGTPALGVLLIMQIVSVFVTLQITCLNAMDRPKHSFAATSLAAAINIGLNIILIPLLGILGAALATLASLTLTAILSYVFLSRRLKISLERRPIRNIIIAAVVMAGAVLVFRAVTGIPSVVYLLAIIGTGALLYFSVLFGIDPKLRLEAGDLLRTVGLL
ncbi:MAG: flippase [Methanoregulaceae archaeon]|jgi:O-antigen/teichoic acid export membrane protein